MSDSHCACYSATSGNQQCSSIVPHNEVSKVPAALPCHDDLPLEIQKSPTSARLAISLSAHAHNSSKPWKFSALTPLVLLLYTSCNMQARTYTLHHAPCCHLKQLS
jgi:hypothetical protein